MRFLKACGKKEEFILDKECKEPILEYFKNEISNKDTQFGNGRLARNLFEKVKFEQAMRLKETGSEQLDLITAKDIENVTQEIKTVVHKKTIGFAC